MADKPTSTSQGLNLATINTTHAGMTSAPTDICKVPPNMAPKPFMNTAPVDRNPIGMTTARTVVDTKKVITIRTVFGSPSDDAHEGTGRGISSGTYRGHAWVLKGAQDLRTEGAAPGRHTDDTLQNGGNTTGMLRDMKMALDAMNAEKGKLQRCTIVEVTFQQDKSPRVVSTKVRGLYLEIVEGSSITVTAVRKNMAAATAAGAPAAACTIPAAGWLNTRFQVNRQGGRIRRALRGDNPLEKKETQDGKDVFLLTTAWVGEKTAPAPSVSPTPGANKADDAQEVARRSATAATSTARQANSAGRVGDVVAPPPDPGRRAFLGLPPAPIVGANGGSVATRAEFVAARDAATAAASQRQSAAIEASRSQFESGQRKQKQMVTGMKTFLDLWSSCTPATITLGASGCTGAFAGQVKVYPEGAFEFDLIAVFETFCSRFEAFMNPVGTVLQGLSAASGTQWDVGVLNKSLFGSSKGKAEKPTLKIAWEWKELERDSTEPGGPKMNQVGLNFGIIIGIAKVVFARADFSVSLFVIAGGPGIGGVAKTILEWAGIEVELGVAMELAVGVTAQLGRDEYHVKGVCDVDTTLTATISLYLIARAGSWGYAKVDVTFAFGIKFKDIKFGGGVVPPISLHMTDQKFTIQFQATIQANVRGLKDGKKFPEIPKNLINPIRWDDGWRTLSFS